MIHHRWTWNRHLACGEYSHDHIVYMGPARYSHAIQPVLVLPQNPSQIVPVGLSSPVILQSGWRAFQNATMSQTAWYHHQAENWIGFRDKDVSDQHAPESLVRFRAASVYDWVDVLQLSLWPIKWLPRSVATTHFPSLSLFQPMLQWLSAQEYELIVMIRWHW